MLNVLRTLVLGGLAAGLLGCLAVFLLFVHYGKNLPEIGGLADYDPPQVTRLLDVNGKTIGEFGDERRSLAALEDLPPMLLNAFVAAEDASFYQHRGVDLFGIMRAVARNLLSMGVRQGASTITQQVVKNLLLSHERTGKRKIKEAILAYRLENRLSKREILYLYANAIYFGAGNYGVAEAARFYFDRKPSELSLGQMAYLAGIPKNPAGYRLDRHPKRAKDRQRYVLRRLLELNYIGKKEFDRWSQAELAFTPPEGDTEAALYVVEEIRERMSTILGALRVERGGLRVRTSLDPSMQAALETALRRNLLDYTARHGYRELEIVPESERKRWREDVEKVHRRRGSKPEDLFAFSALHPPRKVEANRKASPWRTLVRRLTPDGLAFAFVVSEANADTVTVSLGDRLGVLASEDVRRVRRRKSDKTSKPLFAPGRLLAVRLADDPDAVPADTALPVRLRLEQVPEAQTAGVAIDPQTRAVRALVGGFSFYTDPFNRATKAKRQPGSSFKPVVYLTALRQKLVTPASILVDEPLTFRIPGSKPWTPKNFDGKHRGPLRLRQALAFSVNTIAARLIDLTGPQAVIRTAKDLGITSELRPHLSLALGSSEVTVLEMANLYAAFADEGRTATPWLIESIADASGRVLYRRKPDSRLGISREEAALAVSLLRSVVFEGTARRAWALKLPVAGKTGTTNDQRDAWFVGFSPRLACAVWLGYDVNRLLGSGETGGRAALPGWIAFMRRALEGKPKETFPVAPGLVHAWIDPETGFRSNGEATAAMDEVFLPGTGPLDPPEERPNDGNENHGE